MMLQHSYRIMTLCWDDVASRRPTFLELRLRMEHIMKEMTYSVSSHSDNIAGPSTQENTGNQDEVVISVHNLGEASTESEDA